MEGETMQNNLPKQIKEYNARHARVKRWQKLVMFLSCIVVFCTTYALILPAITMSEDTFCGLEEHVHSVEAGCYEVALICGHEDETDHDVSSDASPSQTVKPTDAPTVAPHVHTDECYEMRKTLICGKEESPVSSHYHTADCYSSTLTCTLEEGGLPVHEHGDNCYTASGELICGMQENLIEPHTHTDACYSHELICTLPEGEFGHEHTDDCYLIENILTCTIPQGESVDQSEMDGGTESVDQYSEIADEGDGQVVDQGEALETSSTEAAAHVHTEECYQYTLICEMPEHQHSLACYSDPTADIESASVWERTLPKELSGDWATDLLAVAKSQLGYTESKRNYIVLEDGSVKGYTRYGEWYGCRYEDWCAMFASFCLNYADIPTSDMPRDVRCRTWIESLAARDMYRTGDYVPKAGDLIFFDWENDIRDGVADHVGIVEYVEDGRVHTIEGNSGNSVRRRDYDLDYDAIMGYGELPTQTQPDITKTASIYTDASCESALDDGSSITVTGQMPDDAQVRAYPVDIETEQTVIWAYDISICLPDGTPYEPEEGQSMTVSVYVPANEAAASSETEQGTVDADNAGSEGEEESLLSTALYYVPDSGDMVPLTAEQSGGNVTFTADHFSVYALLATEGINGQSALIREFNNAVANGGETTLQLSQDVAYTSDRTMTLNTSANITIDLNGYNIKVTGAAAPFNVTSGTLTIVDTAQTSDGITFSYEVMNSTATGATGATVENTQDYTVSTNGYIQGSSQPIVQLSGGTFTLQSGVLCGGTGRAIVQSGGTVTLSGGCIYGFSQAKDSATDADSTTFGGAAVISGGTFNISGGVLAGNSAPNGGAIYISGGTLNISGGAISGNTSTRTAGGLDGNGEDGAYRCGGGAIYADGSADIDLSGGYITCNTAVGTGYFDGGGGVFLSGASSMKMTGGYITGNTAQGGGGVRTDYGKEAAFSMSGGIVAGNTATTAEGGGIAIGSGGEGAIYGGHITNNATQSTEYWGGGGLFCAEGGMLNMYSVLVTDNTADGYGGGIGGSSTGQLYIYQDSGGAVYGNHDASGKDAANYAGGSAKNDKDAEAADTDIFQSNGHSDFFCANNSAVTGAMPGGYSANWQGSADGQAVSAGADDILRAETAMGLTSHPTDAAKSAAQKAAKVYVNGNSAYTHGGGIMCSGTLNIGTACDMYNPVYLKLNATTVLNGLSGETVTQEDGEFNFRIVTRAEDSTETVVSETANDADGAIAFDALGFADEGTYTYYIYQAQSGGDVSVQYDSTEYRVTVVVGTESDTALSDGAKLFKRQITSLTVAKRTDDGWANVVADETARSGTVMQSLSEGGAAFINRVNDITSVTVNKVWSGGTVRPEVTVWLLEDGVRKQSVILNETNSWTHTWSDLGYGHSYSVEEIPVAGYAASYSSEQSGNGTIVTITNTYDKEEYVLPNTGGSGTLPIMACGALLVLISALTFIHLRRRAMT